MLVTAHHAEDQIETVLLHLLRGSGVGGLGGISPCRAFLDGLYIVRPLLNASKQDILLYCEENSIDFVNDSTNADVQYMRNALRHTVIPKMRELQPSLDELFTRLAQNAREADDFINLSALEFIKNECTDAIPLGSFNKLHSVLRAKVLAMVYEDFCNSSLEKVHIDALTELCQRAIPHSSVSLPQKKCGKIENGNLIFANECQKESAECFEYIPFSEGVLNTRCGTIIKIEKNPTGKKDPKECSLDVKIELISSDAHFRPRKEGDCINVGKMNKKAKKLISEKKIPLNIRKNLPLLVSNNEILWIPSVAVCDRIKMDKINDGDGFFRITIKQDSEVN
jgi:tRNA(Ile)-lysidine synthase